MYVQHMRRNCALVVEPVSLLQTLMKMEISAGLISKYAPLNMYVNTYCNISH